jgi:hypothetical protein
MRYQPNRPRRIEVNVPSSHRRRTAAADILMGRRRRHAPVFVTHSRSDSLELLFTGGWGRLKPGPLPTSHHSCEKEGWELPWLVPHLRGTCSSPYGRRTHFSLIPRPLIQPITSPRI